MVTAAIGVVFYLIGAAMELKATSDGSKKWADLLGFGIVLGVLVVVRHQANIKRLLAGTENRFAKTKANSKR
ncbi:MAG: hypothetical protein EB117_18605 [Betaproteobacteria bacterium]|nr:hypothetical protein [Betaproteobacteria bacterium]